MTASEQQAQNLKTIQKQLLWLKDKPDGVLFDRRSSFHRVIVLKHGSQIQLYFADPSVTTHHELELSGIMSRIDLNNPLNLLGIYTQAMMLALLWQPKPRRIYVLGFAGGRLPMLFYHYFPELVIESTDIDELIPDIAKKFFAINFDQRQILNLEDGRDYLESRNKKEKFDIVIIDAFRGTGRIPFKFGTVEFYELCKEVATPDAIFCMNIINQDSLFVEKINSFRQCFKHVYFFVHEGAYVVFGTNGDKLLTKMERETIAEALQAEFQFQFPFFQRALNLEAFDEQQKYPSLFGETINQVLSDAKPPISILQEIPSTDPIFYKVGANDICPCGSGLKYKKCHGKRQSS